MKTILLLFVRAYQVIVSPLIGPRCRFQPTCSHYACDALEQHGAVRGCWMTIKRLLRCHPFYKGPFFDPVPKKAEK